jgi:hypothetical protein
MPAGNGGTMVWPLTKCSVGTCIATARPGSAFSRVTVSALRLKMDMDMPPEE